MTGDDTDRGHDRYPHPDDARGDAPAYAGPLGTHLELCRHLVQYHGVPAGFIEAGRYTLGELAVGAPGLPPGVARRGGPPGWARESAGRAP